MDPDRCRTIDGALVFWGINLWQKKVLFDYSLNNDVYRRYDEQRDTQIRPTNNTPSPNRILQAWTTQGDQTVYPRVERRNEIRPNSFYVTDGSFIKLRYIRFNKLYKISFIIFFWRFINHW